MATKNDNEVRYFLIIIMMAVAVVAKSEDTRQGAFNDRVRSLQVQNILDWMAPPVISMGTDDVLVVSFDVLGEDREYLRYELVHCNADWQPSGLVDSEVLDGFNYGDIDVYDFSQMTTTHYVNYRFTIPNEYLRPKVSGNYLVKIYPENDPDDVWAQVRFMLSEQSADIEGYVNTVTDVDYNVGHQQLGLRIDTENASVVDPFNDLIVKVQQNGRIDNEATLRQPLRMQGKHISVYEHQKPLIFKAGNEYRRFETVSTIYPGMGVETIRYKEPYYNFMLWPDKPRNEGMYLYDQTQHGRYLVREYNSDYPDIEADYCVVHFSLEMPEVKGAKVFVDGDMVNRRFDPESLMVYNHGTGRYERSMLLKQGAYNYQYLVVPDGSMEGSTSEIEGDKYQTVNEYLIKVYVRHPGDIYDRLVGVKRL